MRAPSRPGSSRPIRACCRAAEARGGLGFLSDGDLAGPRPGRGHRRAPSRGQWEPALLGAAREQGEAEGISQRDALDRRGCRAHRRADHGTEYARLSLTASTPKGSDKRRNAARALHAATTPICARPGMARGARQRADGQMAARWNGWPGPRHGQRPAPGRAHPPRADVRWPRWRRRCRNTASASPTTAPTDESAAPRICAEFSEPLIKAGVDYTPYVPLPDPGLASAEDRQICIDGVEHGEALPRHFREGLPAASGETLIKDVEITLYVRDRSPEVSFPGRAYVLPAGRGAALPVETVNLDEVELVLRRVSDRNLLRAIQEDYFARPLALCRARLLRTARSPRRSGPAPARWQRAQPDHDHPPAPGRRSGRQPPGIYALTAACRAGPASDAGATQWFVLTDLGLTTLKGTDGLHVFVRGLSDARAGGGRADAAVARNRELARDDRCAGACAFSPPGSRGHGGCGPGAGLARQGEDDLAFLSLTDPAFDLSDRGVAGRARPAGGRVPRHRPRRLSRGRGDPCHGAGPRRQGRGDDRPAAHGDPHPARRGGICAPPVGRDAAGGHVFAMPGRRRMPARHLDDRHQGRPGAPSRWPAETCWSRISCPSGSTSTCAARRADPPGRRPPLDQVAARYLFGAPGAGLEADGSCG